MGIIVKKISKKTFFSLLSVFAFIAALFGRLFFGGSHINLSKLESKAGDVLGEKDKFISTARADTPGCSCSTGEGGGCGSSSGEGSDGGSEGDGEGGEGDY